MVNVLQPSLEEEEEEGALNNISTEQPQGVFQWTHELLLDQFRKPFEEALPPIVQTDQFWDVNHRKQ